MNIRRLAAAMISLLFLFLVPCQANDNAQDGNGSPTGHGASGKGYYHGREYLYKVSIYVGKSDTASYSDPSLSGFQLLGNSFYLRPRYLTFPTVPTFSLYNKVQHQEGAALVAPTTVDIVTWGDIPPPPVVCGGTISAVKSYFGDTNTLRDSIEEIANQNGQTSAQLAESLTVTINGTTGQFSASEILPIETDGVYSNKVPWLILYEPIVLAHLRDGSTVLALTATEYALAQKLGYFDFHSREPDGQYISLMTHALLPSSIMLEQSWFGFPAPEPPAGRVKWSDDSVIDYGGWGMRMLGVNGRPRQNNTAYDTEYRVNTEAITSFEVTASADVTPDDPAYVTLRIDGASGTTVQKRVVLPQDSTQLVWIKWPTPANETYVTVVASISGNAAVTFTNGSRGRFSDVSISSLEGADPPNPEFQDEKPYGFAIPEPPDEVDVSEASWTVWDCFWSPDWQYEPDWTWVPDPTLPAGGHWRDDGDWVDNGNWDYALDRFSARLSADVALSPDEHCPTAEEVMGSKGRGWQIKSAYGIKLDVTGRLSHNATSADVTNVQNVLVRYPEFQYEDYHTLLEPTSTGRRTVFSLPQNPFSHFSNRVHFTPLWYPDGIYQPAIRLIDCWTPAGMLRINKSSLLYIKGTVYDDWRVVPLE